jgi:hypothetical protein
MSVNEYETFGHAPGPVRRAFVAAVDVAHWCDADDADQTELRRLSGLLWNCTDTLPREYCVMLALPAGSTYAVAARHCRGAA